MKARRVYMVRWRRANQKVVRLRGRRTETAYQMKYRNLSLFCCGQKFPMRVKTDIRLGSLLKRRQTCVNNHPVIISCLHHTSSNVIVLTTRTQSAKVKG